MKFDMTSSLLYGHDATLLLVLFVIFVGFACFCIWFVYFSRAKEFAQSFVGIVPTFIGLASTVFALTAAFLGASVWDSFNANNDSVKKEHQALIVYLDLIKNAPGLSNSGLQPLAKAYIDSAINDEWPLLSKMQISPTTVNKFNQLYSRTIEVAMKSEPVVERMLIKAVETLQLARLSRIEHRFPALEPFRWAVLILVALLAQLSIVVTHLDKPVRPSAFVLGIFTVLILVVVGLLSLSLNPYEGFVTVTSDYLKDALKQLP